jgi:hypothetical protein
VHAGRGAAPQVGVAVGEAVGEVVGSTGAEDVVGAGAELDVGAEVVGSGTPCPVSPWISALSGSFSFGVPLRTAFKNFCQMAPGSPDP